MRNDAQLPVSGNFVCAVHPQMIPIWRRKLTTTGKHPSSRSYPSEQYRKDVEEHWHSAVPIRLEPTMIDYRTSPITPLKKAAVLIFKNEHRWFSSVISQATARS